MPLYCNLFNSPIKKPIHFIESSFYRFSLIAFLTLLFSCSDAMNHQLNLADWPEVKHTILNDNSRREMERRYIVDQISFLLNNLDIKGNKPGTFKEKINDFSSNYFVQLDRYRVIKENNAMLQSMIKLKGAETVSIDKEKGFIIMNLSFENVFDKEIDYIVLKFEYEDDYGNIYFNETSKLSHQTAKDFNVDIEVIMTDIFKNENEFIFLNSKQSASEVLEKNYGIKSNKKIAKKDYLMEGLRISVIGVLFKDGQGLMHKKEDWKYYE